MELDGSPDPGERCHPIGCDESCCRVPFALVPLNRSATRDEPPGVAGRKPVRRALLPHLAPENMPPEIARWLNKAQPDRIREQPVDDAAPAAQPMSIVTAERVEDARTIVNAIAAEYATVTGGAKPHVGSWTFRKDMAVLGSWFAYRAGIS